MNLEGENDDPLDIVLEDPATEGGADGENQGEKTEDPEPKADPVDDSIEKLREQLENERKGRVEAERRANEAAQTAHASKSEAQDANLHLITNAIKTVEQNNEILKANYKAAMAEQDFDTVAELQLEMSSNAAKLLQLEQGKKALEEVPKSDAPRPFTPDPVEALASQLTPRSAAWVRAHPEYASDLNKYNAMLAAHNLAVANGIAPDTDDYFEAVEESLRIRRPVVQQEDDPMAAAAQATQRRSAPPAAPVSRSGATPGAKPTRVTLSAEEREMAEMMGQTPEEYARNKLALIKEGKLH